MPLVITDSSNVSVLDSKIVIDLCNGNFIIDLSPSIWVGTGNQNVLGANIIVKNENTGILAKDLPSSGYDIVSPMSSSVTVAIPTAAGSYQYGQYSFEVQLTDSTGEIYSLVKTETICAPSGSEGGKNGIISAEMIAKCKDSKLIVSVSNMPSYNGVLSDTQTNSFTLKYPTASGVAPLTSTIRSFSVVLWNGVYEITGTSCANYILGDNVSAQVKYTLSCSKNAQCSLSSKCVNERLQELNDDLEAACNNKERKTIEEKVTKALLLLRTIDALLDYGSDASEYIEDLKDVLGCDCSCDTSETPVGGTPAGDVVINGCNITSQTVGNTTTYTINNYAYQVVIVDNGGVFVVTSTALNGCTQTQTLTFSITKAYAQIKSQINTQTEWDFWASVWKKSLNGLDPSCFGLTQEQFIALSAKDFMAKVIELGCKGGNCDSIVKNSTTSVSGQDVTVAWEIEANTGLYETAVYVDGVLQGVVLAPDASIKLIGLADNTNHVYNIVAKCQNGSIGNSIQGNFTYSGCPLILTPTVSSNNVSNASCPFDLTTLLSSTPPSGIVYEWHTFNNTLDSTKVATPNSVSNGNYYLFAKDADGCYSQSVQVTIACSSVSSCTAPQNVSAQTVSNGIQVLFQSAVNPPSGNSYSVKRRLASDPDVSGSYTTIGDAVWSVSLNKWFITDTSRVQNTMYVYRAFSNCTSTQPYADVSYADIACANMVLSSVGSTLEVIVSRTPTVLSADISGGTPPYNFQFAIRKISGACEAHTIATPTGTTSLSSASTNYTTTPYASTVYGYKCTVTDNVGTVVDSPEITSTACLVPETMIAMKGGKLQRLEDISEGDELSEEGNFVEAWEDLTVNELYVINGGLLKASASHRHILESGVIESEFLNVGDKLISGNGEAIEITKIEKETGEFRVINIATTNQTYIANGVLTHNKLACP